MASQGKDLSHKAEEITGQAQAKKDELVKDVSNASQAVSDKTCSATESAKNSASETKDQSANFLQQTGEQVKSMAQGAADAVKNTLGINSDGSSK